MPKGEQPKRVEAANLVRADTLFDLLVIFNQVKGFAEFRWTHRWTAGRSAHGRIRCLKPNELTWDLEIDEVKEAKATRIGRESIRTTLSGWLDRIPTNPNTVTARWIRSGPGGVDLSEDESFEEGFPIYPWLENNVVTMAEEL